MTFEPITRLEIENYGCIRKASFDLSPLHALIGPNDSGKSTTLRALRTVTQFAAGSFRSSYDPFAPNLGMNTQISFRYLDHFGYGIVVQDLDIPVVFEKVLTDVFSLCVDGPPRSWQGPSFIHSEKSEPASRVSRRVTAPTLVRFDPDQLREPSQLIPEDSGIHFANERGTGLGGVFDAILNRDTEAFSEIQAKVCALFPSVAKLGLININQAAKTISVTLRNGTRIGADQMSEGLLYFLGFMALRHIDNSRLFLIEEPENGLHPARIAEVMAVLREISKTSQVIIATHSPLVVNELEGHEVSVVTRDPERGTQVTLLKDVPGFDLAMKVYQPGEFWLSYSDGNQETPLLTGKPRA